VAVDVAGAVALGAVLAGDGGFQRVVGLGGTGDAGGQQGGQDQSFHGSRSPYGCVSLLMNADPAAPRRRAR